MDRDHVGSGRAAKPTSRCWRRRARTYGEVVEVYCYIQLAKRGEAPFVRSKCTATASRRFAGDTAIYTMDGRETISRRGVWS